MSTVHLKALTWQDVRHRVNEVNPVLGKIIDDLSPSSNFKLYQFDYPYGTEFVQRGDFYLPHEGGLISLQDPAVPVSAKTNLGYNRFSNPLSLVLNKSIEFFILTEGRIIPFATMRTGEVFGLGNVFDGFISHCPPSFIWNVTAGARSVSMLSKISDSISHRRLVQHYQLQSSCPKSLADHWGIFREIANHDSFGDPWSVELLFFSHEWVKHLNDDAWTPFRVYLQNLVWEKTAYWRSQFVSDLVWKHIQRQENIKPSAYVADIVKYLFAVGVGALPGFMPAMDNELGPIDRICEAYQTVYRLRDYPPIIMQPEYFDYHHPLPTYTSLQFLSVMDLSPKANERSSTIADLYAAQSLVKRYLRGIRDGNYKMEGTWLYEMAQAVEYRFFHSNASQYPNIENAAEILALDARFQAILDQNPGAAFPSTSRFLRGCVQISG